MNNMIFAFWFDSGRIEDSFYGQIVFEYMVKGKEISKNPSKMIVSLGDVFTVKSHIDIEPYVLKDEYCTIDFDNFVFKDYPFCWIIEDINSEIAIAIDNRLKSELRAYAGLSHIDITNTMERKQFWKYMVRKYAIYMDIITCFQDPDEVGEFCHLELANRFGYIVEYDKEAEVSEIEKCGSLQSTLVKTDNDLEIKKQNLIDIDRDLFSLNYSIRQEIQISGVLIWRAINDIDKIFFNSNGDLNEILVEYPFLTLYHASQGIERIQKAIIELVCKKRHVKEAEKHDVYKLLISHSHDKLNNWIEKNEDIKLNTNCKKLIIILMNFYKTIRYARYSDKAYKHMISPEYTLLLELKNKKTKNLNAEVKNNFGKYLGELSDTYFKLFCKLCNQLGIYAYELVYKSAASIVYNYNEKSKNLYMELKQRQQGKKEVLYWLIKNARKYPKYNIAKEEALDFDEDLIEQYLTEFIVNPEDGQDYFTEFDFLYDELCTMDKNKWRSRIDLIEYIIDTN